MVKNQSQTRHYRDVHFIVLKRFGEGLFGREISHYPDSERDHFSDLMKHETLSLDFERDKLHTLWDVRLRTGEMNYVPIRSRIQRSPALR